MRAVRRSPLFRIALLSLAVLSAHTARTTNVRHSFPAAPPCPRKVAAAQPDSENKAVLPLRQTVQPRIHPRGHGLFGHTLFLADTDQPYLLLGTCANLRTLAQWSADISPQRHPFVLRI